MVNFDELSGDLQKRREQPDTVTVEIPRELAERYAAGFFPERWVLEAACRAALEGER